MHNALLHRRRHILRKAPAASPRPVSFEPRRRSPDCSEAEPRLFGGGAPNAMAPKKRATAAAKLALTMPTPTPLVASANAKYMEVVTQKIQAVHAFVPDLKNAMPITMADGSDIMAFDLGTFGLNYKTTQSYKCGGNMSWLSTTTPTPELPLSETRMTLLKTHFSPPAPCPFLVVGVDKDTTKEELAHAINSNALMLATPVERLHAWWACFADACKAEDTDLVSKFRYFALTAEMHMKHMAKADLSWHAMQHREDVATDFEALRCTPFMRVLNFAAFKDREEAIAGPLPAPELTRRYSEKLKFSVRSEKVTAGWVDMACTFLNRMFNIPRVRDILIEADDLPAGTNPLEGMTKLQCIISKAKTADRISLVVESLLDMRKAGFL